MDPYPFGMPNFTGTRFEKFKGKTKYYLTVGSFAVAFLLFWLLHILFLGWFFYLFKPEAYAIKAGKIIEDQNRDNGRRTHKFWWNRHWCAAGKIAALNNDTEDYVVFTLRTHPFYLNSDFMYVTSKGYKARWLSDEEKIYSV